MTEGGWTKSRIKLVVALIFLGFSGWVVSSSLFRSRNPREQGSDFTPIHEEEERLGATARNAQVDLLAKFGSFDRKSELPEPFRHHEQATRPRSKNSAPPDRGSAQTTRDTEARSHEVTLILLTRGAPRAVVDGELVGIGDRIPSGRVIGIRADGVLVEGADKRLFFPLHQR